MGNMVSNKFINSNNSGLYKQLSDRSPEEIKIKLKHGEWEVEITCLESRVKQVVADVLSSLDTAKLNGPVVQAQFNELRHEIESLKSRPSADFGSANKA
ncbi:MAG TPA: hypothetical protein VHK86_01840, partial [Nitrososphaera sp.]|nr:hypothetical protein [Nitrososphaera sp.]